MRGGGRCLNGDGVARRRVADSPRDQDAGSSGDPSNQVRTIVARLRAERCPFYTYLDRGDRRACLGVTDAPANVAGILRPGERWESDEGEREKTKNPR